MSYRCRAAWLLSLVCLAVPMAQADDDDTFFLREQARRAVEQQTQGEEQLAAPPGTLLYEGQRYQVPDQLDALTTAIYVAINTQQWTQLPDFIRRYQQLPGHRPALVAMAESLLARFNGDYPLALQRMEQASELEPKDARILLEQARLWFEDYQESRARDGFLRAVDAGLPLDAQALVQQYLQAIDIRGGWHGSVAFGMGYNDNINQANGYYSCLSSFAGFCLFERQMPEAIHSEMFNYELSLQRRFNLSGNHNLVLRPTSYGSYYPNTNPSETATLKDYSTNLAQLQFGYQYLDSRDNVSVTPYLEHFYRNRETEYVAHGLQVEWRRTLNRQWQISNRLDAKRHEYTPAGERLGADFKQYQWDMTVSYMPRADTSLYGGVTLGRRKYEIEQASSKDWAVRGGVYHSFAGKPGFYVNVLGIYRELRNDAYDFFLGDRRDDKQQVYIASLGAEGWKIAGLSPELRVRYSKNRSNLDWAFGFEQTEASLMLRRNF